MSKASTTAELLIRLVTDAGNYCRLPRSVVGLCHGHTVVKLLMTPQVEVYVSWNGGVSQSDCIEIPRSLVNKHNSEFLQDGSFCDAVLLCGVPDAVDVSLVPASAMDWDIISTQASYVENNMLKSHTVLYVGQIVLIRIGPSLAAKLVVQSVSLAGGAQTTPDFIIGRISNATTLIIAPHTTAPTSSTLDTPSEPAAVVWEEVNIEPHSHLQNLFVLPDHCRHQDSGFACDIQNPHFRDVYDEETQDLSDSYLNSFLEDNNNPVEQSTAQGTGTSGLINGSVNDVNTCYVHPLYFIAAYEAAIQRALTTSEWNTVHSMLQNKVIYGCVEVARRTPTKNTTILPGLTTAPLTMHALVTIVVSTATRPGCCSLPASVRKGMNLEAYDVVRLYVVNRRMGVMQLPTSITLTKVTLGSADGNGMVGATVSVQSVSTTTAATGATSSTTSREIPESQVKIALMRLIDANCTSTTPFILHNSQVLSLVLPRTNAENPRGNSSGGGSGVYECVDYVVRVVNKAASGLQRTAVPPYALLYSTSNTCSTNTNTITTTTAATASAARQQAILQACMEVLTIHVPSKSALPDTVDDENCANLSDTLLAELTSSGTTTCNSSVVKDPFYVPVFDRTKHALLREICPLLLPIALRHCIQTHTTPSTATLLTGGAGTGKTALLQQIADILHQNVRTQTRVRTLNCAELRNKPFETVLSELNEVFSVSAFYPTSLIVLDNVDVLCPAGSESGTGTLRDERSSVITLHLELLLRENHAQHLARVQNARELESSTITDTALLTERRQEVCLHNATYVIATTDSVGSVAPSLLQALHLRTVVAMEALAESQRIVALKAALQRLEVGMAECSRRDVDRVCMAMQGYRIHDVHCVARRVCSAVLRRTALCITSSSTQSTDATASTHSITPPHLTCVASVEDVLQACATYIPVAGTAKLRSQDSTSAISWADVGGYGAEKQEILDTIKTPLVFGKLFKQCPIKLPRSVLLYGPPGCGKTLLAQAAGREFGRGFISVRGPELLDKYIGASEKAVRELFQRARESGRPCLIFFDEFESLAPRRGKDNTGVTDRIVNQLLTFIDGVESSMGTLGGGGEEEEGGAEEGHVFIMAATSRPDLIDAALLRPGRIEKHIYIGLPEEADRRAILRTALSKLPTGPEVLDRTVAEISAHPRARLLSAADWRAVVNTAFLSATHAFINRQDAADCAHERTVLIAAQHLLDAFYSTKASITGLDMNFFSSVYQRFEKRTDKTKAGAAPGSNVEDLDERLQLSYA